MYRYHDNERGRGGKERYKVVAAGDALLVEECQCDDFRVSGDRVTRHPTIICRTQLLSDKANER
jgi:hypothetical protein